MAWNDLAPKVQEGLNFRANRIKDANGNQQFATGKEYMDFIATTNGLEAYAEKQAVIAARRIRLLEKEANAALAAQVDALADEG